MKISDMISSNQIFAILSKGAEGGKVILVNILVARFLGVETLGIYAYIIGLVSLVAVIAEFRILNVLVKELVVSNDNDIGCLLGSSLLSNVIFSLVGLSCIALYVFLFEHDSDIVIGLFIASTIYIAKIPRVFRALFISLEKNKLIMIAEFFSTIIMISVSALIVFYSDNLNYILAIRVVDCLVISFFLIVFFKKLNIKLSVDLAKMKLLIYKSAPLVLSAAAMIIFQRIDIVMIKMIKGNEMAGLYSAATNYMMVFSLLPMVLSESLSPRLFRKNAIKHNEVIQEKYIRIIVFSGFLMSCLMGGSSYYFIPLLYGDEFYRSVQPALILSLSPVLISLGCSAGQIIINSNLQSKAFIKSIFACVINIIFNFLLIPKYGINGAAIATVIGFSVANFISHKFIFEFNNIFRMQVNVLTFNKKGSNDKKTF
ncbi:hypothetical protein CWO27_11555 [Vibrio sp. 10N.286.51.C3]|uniref:flippase n=1 Tax=unclassified Vibrio TaxID=2614977 RepID=UPI000D3A5488|nr:MULTISPECIES: flippase [unclassified Vibrio]PTP14239.1 hypothetical protein CWO27_11555 [Vibrio sp. 10N.286.51.C3]TKE67236.1 flippase [Vibrio sp. F12]